MSFENLTKEQIEEILNIGSEKKNKDSNVKKAHFSQLEFKKAEEAEEDISFLNEVELDLQVELGSTTINLREVLNLYKDQVIPLNRIAGDTVDLKVNNVWLAHGEVLVLNEVLGIRITSFNREEEYFARGVK
jgi:flagellar motor switch protein FliN/FliY